ncbi:S60 ribosomal protein L28 [Heterostelium album PN500]|uniref:S60 ribosomal protein L28 n=1 Tax=Heterostelium pallidum (strain ATCC 26659 / Pp 5 / PN500) TaxID=670386 RepID=D3B641_HETP5|nr:S60 ribosomal protein L28 [Heterostelium album PN500]EFA83339.1 S60 ribosomal protein L28 [Heterostelium album PN500]|eukprot:XP_020435456.1 S60 ribosomal protein L28 [Heterostelium album PN500]
MSSELIWNVIRGNNAFKITRGKTSFSSEAGNLRNKHSSKYSGLANRKVVDVNVNAAGAIELSAKRTKKAANPAASFGRVQLSKNYRSSAKAIRTLTTGYAPELRAAALARYHRLNKTAKAANMLKARAAKKAAKTAAN